MRRGGAGRLAMQMVLVGAGHAHLEALRGLAGRGGLPAGTRPTVMTHGRHTTYSGMPPGVIAGLYRRRLVARLARLPTQAID